MARGRDANGVPKDAGEAVSGAPRATAVEAEDVLVEVALQVLGADGAVVGARQPALDQPEDEMDGGQALVGLAPRARGGTVPQLRKPICRCSSSAAIPPLPEVTSQIARTECCLPQVPHSAIGRRW